MEKRALVASIENSSRGGITPSMSLSFVGGAGLRAVRGGVTPTLTRASAATVKDWEGVLWNCPSGEIRGELMRREKNLAPASEDLTNATYTKTQITAALTGAQLNGWNTTRLTLTNGLTSHFLGGGSLLTIGNSVWISYAVDLTGITSKAVAIEASAGSNGRALFTWTGPQTISVNTNIAGGLAGYKILGDYQAIIYAYWTGVASSNTVLYIGTYGPYNGDGQYIDVTRVSYNDVNGRTNQQPPEYVSKGVLASPYHGWGTDGICYFSTQNGNTISGNVVTEAIGAQFPQYPLGAHIEYAGGNLVARSQDSAMTGWIAGGTPTIGTAITNGDLTLPLLGDDDAVAVESFQTAVVFTANGTRCASIFIKPGTAAGCAFAIFDSTGVAFRLSASVVWNNGFPSVTMTTGVLEDVEYWKNGIWRIKCQTTAVTFASSHVYVVYPAGLTAANTGTTYMGGFQAEDIDTSSSYFITTGAAAGAGRLAEAFSLATLGAWFNAAAGTLVAGISLEGTVTADTIPLAFWDGTANNLICIQRLFTGTYDRLQGLIIAGGVSQANPQARGYPMSLRVPALVGLSYKLNSAFFCVNWMQAQTKLVAVTIPTVTSFISGPGTNFYLASLDYYPYQVAKY